MTKVLIASDGSWIRDLVRNVLASSDTQVIECKRGQDVRDAVANNEPDVVVCDMQIGNMGGVAVSIDLRMEAEAGRIPETKIVLLLDREADRFLAKRASVDAELLKPIDAMTLTETIDSVL